MQKKYDITSQKFGRLLVLERDITSIGQRNSKWICKCDCGNIVSVVRCSLVSGHTKSCGCSHYETHNQTHGMTRTPIYKIWLSMRYRCKSNNKNKKNECYRKNQITVCEQWQNDFTSFYNWAMANGYQDGLSIDRIDNLKGYSPQNCRWITLLEQQRNKTNNVKIIYNGEEILLIDLCRKLNFPYKKAHRRFMKLKRKNLDININKIFF